MDKKIKSRLKEFINDDSCYSKYRENPKQKFSDYDKYFIRHCKDIEESINYIENLERFAITVGKVLTKKNIDKSGSK